LRSTLQHRCALRANPSTTDISVADLERMYSRADSMKLLLGSKKATALDWVKVTAQITAAIAAEKTRALTLSGFLHSVFDPFNGFSSAKLCPCMTCNPGVWKDVEFKSTS